MNTDDILPTRQSLLSKLKDWNNQDSWRQFFNSYWRLIYALARRAGLDDQNAQEVVQETIISVAKEMPDFQYDRKKGAFKSWLRTITRRRISDHLRKVYRQEDKSLSNEFCLEKAKEIADESSTDLLWEEQWREHVARTATERVKGKVKPEQFQIFDLYVLQRWPASKVAKALGVSMAQVYLARHRIGSLLKKEIHIVESQTN